MKLQNNPAVKISSKLTQWFLSYTDFFQQSFQGKLPNIAGQILGPTQQILAQLTSLKFFFKS